MRLFFLFLVATLGLVSTIDAQCLSGSCDTGTGVYLFKDGSEYTGEFKGGLPDGEGVWVYPKGDAVRGLFKKGMPVDGSDFAQAAPSKEQTGCISGNCQNGIGVYVDEQGNRYVGYFKHGQPSGKGKCYYKNGNRYDGNWKAGLPNGQGVMLFSNGLSKEGDWNDGALGPNRLQVKKQAKKKKKKGRTFAVVIGIADYSKMDKLDYSDDDARRFYTFLENKTGKTSTDVHLLIDEDATASNIKLALKDVAQRASSDDEIIIYYSGHGIEKAIIPIESDGETNLLSHQEISNILSLSKSKSRVFYLDACNTKEPKAQLKTNTGLIGMTIFYSSSPGENSLESNELKQGVFSYYLIDGLNGAADQDGNRIISIDELYTYVSTNVKNYTDELQYPTLVVRTQASR